MKEKYNKIVVWDNGSGIIDMFEFWSVSIMITLFFPIFYFFSNRSVYYEKKPKSRGKKK